MRTFTFLLAPVAAFAALAAPASAQMQPSDAPYDTKLKCGAFNAFMSGFEGEDTEAGVAADSRAEAWVSLALMDKADQMEQVATDFEGVAAGLTEQMEAKVQAEDTAGIFAVLNQYLDLCEPYGG